MGWLRSLVGGGAASASAAAADNGKEQPQPVQDASNLQEPALYTPDGKAAVLKGAVVATPPAVVWKADGLAMPTGATPPTPDPHRRLDMDSPPPEGHWDGEMEEEGEEAWHYGADNVRRGWRHTENHLALWVAAVLVVALGINIGVGGATGA